jgi:8-oxo-dGTP pyrophosphatase MutT (NUDIX family)
MRYRRDVSAGIIVFHRTPDGCRFLLLLSRLTKRPLWEFPKGGVDEGETVLEAALRELQEETGLLPGDVTLRDGFQHKEDYRFTSGKGEERVLIRKAVTYFLAEASRTEVTLSAHEASDYAWLTLPEAMTKVRYAARRRMLEAAARAAGCLDDSGLGKDPPKP